MSDGTVRGAAEDDRVTWLADAIRRDVGEQWGAERADELRDRVQDLARAIAVVERSAGDTVRTDFFRPAHD
jgi:hypothetical protein